MKSRLFDETDRLLETAVERWQSLMNADFVPTNLLTHRVRALRTRLSRPGASNRRLNEAEKQVAEWQRKVTDLRFKKPGIPHHPLRR